MTKDFPFFQGDVWGHSNTTDHSWKWENAFWRKKNSNHFLSMAFVRQLSAIAQEDTSSNAFMMNYLTDI